MTEQMVPLSLLTEWMERALKAETQLALIMGPRRCVQCGQELHGIQRSTKAYCSERCKAQARSDRERLDATVGLVIAPNSHTNS